MKNRILASLTLVFALFAVFAFYNQGITGFVVNVGACNFNADSVGETYTLSGNLGTCSGENAINVLANNIIVDCNGNEIIGNGVAGSAMGINVGASLTGITLKNCIIKDFLFGISTAGSGVSIENVQIYDDDMSSCYTGGNPTEVGDLNYCGAEADLPVTDNAPTITSLDFPPDDETIINVPVDFNFTVWDDFNVSTCDLWSNFSGTWELNSSIAPENNHSETFNFTLSPLDGEYIWNVNCTDNATTPNSVWYAAGNYSVTINTTDPPPTITELTHPSSTFSAIAEPLDFNFTVHDNWNVSNCSLWTNISTVWAETAFRTIGTNVSATYNISLVVGVGDYIWNVNCTDNASNSSWYVSNASVVISDPAPTLSLYSPSSASTVSAVPMNFTFNVSDNYNVSSCSLFANFSGAWSQNDSLEIQNNTQGIYNLTLSPTDGIYLWGVNCSDNASQTTWSDNYTVTVNAVDDYPTVTLASPSNAASITASSTTLQITTLDDYNGTACTLWTNFNGSWAANETLNVSVPASTTTSFTVSPAYGTYTWNANCTDNASQSSWAADNFTFALQQATTTSNTGGSSGGGSDDDDEEEVTPALVIPAVVPVEEEEEEVEEVIEEVVEEELFAPPVEEEEAEKQESISNAKRSKSEIVEVECDPAESNCDEWFDNLITKMDRTLDKVDLTKNVTFDNETNTTKVAISIVPEEDLEDFRYYQSIPKCMAIYVHLVKFKNTDFEVLKDDPLIVWSFANVQKGEELDLGFEVMGDIPENCYEFISELLYEEQEKFSGKHMFGLITGLSVLGLVALGITYSSKYSHHLVAAKNVGTKFFKKSSKSEIKVPAKVDKKIDIIKERMKQL